jgi:hypothetical protein
MRAAAKNHQSAVDLLNSKLDLFYNRGEDVELYSNSIDCKFMYNTKSRKFWFGYIKERQDQIQPELSRLSGVITWLYNNPTKKNYGGTLAGIQIMVDGSTNFEDHFLQINKKEMLFVLEYPDSPIHLAFKTMLQRILKENHNNLRSLADTDHVKYILDHVLAKCLEIFTSHESVTDRLNRMRFPNPKSLFDYIRDHAGVCRHRSFFIGKLISLCIKSGILDGQVKSRCRFGKDDGHAWIEYHPEYKQSSDDYYVIDGMLNFCGARRKLAPIFADILNEYENGEPDDALNFDSYSRLAMA